VLAPGRLKRQSNMSSSFNLACARSRPEKKAAQQSRMQLLFSEKSEVVTRARAAK
jgi:hypothetical protein